MKNKDTAFSTKSWPRMSCDFIFMNRFQEVFNAMEASRFTTTTEVQDKIIYQQSALLVLLGLWRRHSSVASRTVLLPKSTIASLLYDYLHPALKRGCRGRITNGVLLQRDNALAHISQVEMVAMAELGYILVPYPPYSPDLAPNDFLFEALKVECDLVLTYVK